MLIPILRHALRFRYGTFIKHHLAGSKGEIHNGSQIPAFLGASESA
jgi:hypothetical protein